MFPGLSRPGLRPPFGPQPAAPRPATAPPALGRSPRALPAALGPTWRPGPGSLPSGSAGPSAVGVHEDGLAAALGRFAGPTPDSRVTVRRGARPRVWPQQPPQTLWAAAAPAPSSAPRRSPPACALGVRVRRARFPRSPRGGSSPTPRAAHSRSPGADPAEPTPLERGAEGASALPRGPRVGSGPWGPLATRSGPLLSSAVPRREFPDPGPRTLLRR